MLKFHLRVQLYRWRRFFYREKRRKKSLLFQIKYTIWDITRAVGFVILLLTIEHLFSQYWIIHSHSFPDWLKNLKESLPNPIYPDDKDAVIALISVIASVTGVILALFYPVLATIASTAYSKVHASIRNLLLDEEETQTYLRRLTYLTACSITVLLGISFKFFPGGLLLTFITLYSLMTLFGILKIGLGIYNFFEPSTLAKIVYNKLRNSIKDVTKEGEYWKDENFQNHNYRLAFEQTESLSLIMSLCLKDNELKEASFKSIFKTYLATLQFYLSRKLTIPITSLWYPNLYQYPSYFESDMTVRQISVNTFIMPKEERNHYWLEERIANNLSRGLKTVVKEGKTNLLGELILMTYNVFISLSKNVDLRTGELILDIFLENVRSINYKKIEEEEIPAYENWKEELSSVQVFCYAILRFQAGVFGRVALFTADKITKEYEKINWSDRESVYNTDFIPELYESLIEIHKFTQNELMIEGERITPDWYFIQRLTAELLLVVHEKIIKTVVLFESHLLSLAKYFDAADNCLLSSYTAQLGLETLYKLDYRIDILKQTLNTIDELEICEGTFIWKKLDFKEIDGKFLKYRNDCILILAKNAENLVRVEWNNQYPDVYAHTYSILMDKLDECFKENDYEFFKECFEPFLKSSLIAFNSLNKTFRSHTNPLAISYQVLLDPMEISGYAYIYSVVYKSSRYWDEVKRVWDECFSPSKENIELLIKYYNYYKSNLFGVGVNYTNKRQRESTLEDVTKTLGVKIKNIDDFLVKLFLHEEPYGRSFYDVAELFIEIYLFTFREAKSSVSKIDRRIFHQWLRNIENPNTDEYDF